MEGKQVYSKSQVQNLFGKSVKNDAKRELKNPKLIMYLGEDNTDKARPGREVIGIFRRHTVLCNGKEIVDREIIERVWDSLSYITRENQTTYVNNSNKVIINIGKIHIINTSVKWKEYRDCPFVERREYQNDELERDTIIIDKTHCTKPHYIVKTKIYLQKDDIKIRGTRLNVEEGSKMYKDMMTMEDTWTQKEKLINLQYKQIHAFTAEERECFESIIDELRKKFKINDVEYHGRGLGMFHIKIYVPNSSIECWNDFCKLM